MEQVARWITHTHIYKKRQSERATFVIQGRDGMCFQASERCVNEEKIKTKAHVAVDGIHTQREKEIGKQSVGGEEFERRVWK